jgi:hypothetical protein
VPEDRDEDMHLAAHALHVAIERTPEALGLVAL